MKGFFYKYRFYFGKAFFAACTAAPALIFLIVVEFPTMEHQSNGTKITLIIAYLFPLSILTTLLKTKKRNTIVQPLLGQLFSAMVSCFALVLTFWLLNNGSRAEILAVELFMIQCASSGLCTVVVCRLYPFWGGPPYVLLLLKQFPSCDFTLYSDIRNSPIVQTTVLSDYFQNPEYCLDKIDAVYLYGADGTELNRIAQDCAERGIDLYLIP